VALPTINTNSLPTAYTGGTSGKHLFVGFNTQVPTGSRNYKLYDIETIKRDLLNAIYMRVGESVMRPTAGCIIWDKLFEPMTAGVVQQITDNLRSIISKEPRVQLLNLQVITTYPQAIIVDMLLRYIHYDKVEPLRASFDKTISGEYAS
jgi:phage baseplate assembly protein W